jgi:hypothetical protein
VLQRYKKLSIYNRMKNTDFRHTYLIT